MDKRGIWNGIDFATVHITYSANQQWGAPTPAAAVAVATPAAVAPVVAAPDVDVPKPAHGSDAKLPLNEGLHMLVADVSRLASLGVNTAGPGGVGFNAVSRVAPDHPESWGTWIGTDGDYTNEFSNDSGEDLILAVWGPWRSWLNAHPPAISVSMPAGTKKIISFASGSSGAWSAFYSDTPSVNTADTNGQLSNTWGEYTFSPQGVVDVSREVHAHGHGMEVVNNVNSCVTNMDQCVFKCNDAAAEKCTTGYSIQNCGALSGSMNGGCGWDNAPSAKIKTKFL